VDNSDVDNDGNREESDFLAYVLDPTLIAVLFGLLSLPFVALSLDATDSRVLNPAQVPWSDLGRWSGATGAVLAAALIAGTIGAPVARMHGVIGGLFTMLVAWIVAIAALPVLPVLLHFNHGGTLGFATYCPIGPGTCRAAIIASEPLSGVQQVWLFWIAPLLAPGPFALLGLGVAYWTRTIRGFTAEEPLAT
jgi:hypothetical protein